MTAQASLSKGWHTWMEQLPKLVPVHASRVKLTSNESQNVAVYGKERKGIGSYMQRFNNGT